MEDRVLFISNLNHNGESLRRWVEYSPERSITEIFGSSNVPLGILSIEAYVKKTCPHVKSEILDLNNEFIEQLLCGNMEENVTHLAKNLDLFLRDRLRESIHSFKPAIAAVSSLFDKCIPTLFTICKIIKELDANILVIAGGHPVNNLYREILLNGGDDIDAISLGEGEIPFSELLAATDKASYIKNSDYFVTREKCLAGEDKKRKTTFVENLDDIPFYDYDSYLKKYGDVVLSYHNNILDSTHSFDKQAVIMTSRGCPYSCVFCASGTVHGKKMRSHSLDRVKAEIDYFIDRYKVESIGFIDDHILFDVNRAIEICNYTGSKGVDFRFPNGLAVTPITRELVKALEKNNVKEVQLALESGSERVLQRIIRKPLTMKRAAEVFDYFQDTGIFVKVFLVIGFPDETRADIEEGLEFLRTADFHWASISSPTPISGSKLYDQAIEGGYIDRFDYGKISFFSDIFSEQVKENTGFEKLRYTVNLDVNFVHNPYMRMGRIQEAKERFRILLESYPDHAFAWYYLHKCQELLKEDSHVAAERYNEIIKSNREWRDYADYFKLETEIL